jgi:hypothetical protein
MSFSLLHPNRVTPILPVLSTLSSTLTIARRTLAITHTALDQPLQMLDKLCSRVEVQTRGMTPEMQISSAVCGVVADSVHQGVTCRQTLHDIGGVAEDVGA